MTSQRDRFRQRNAELEEELKEMVQRPSQFYEGQVEGVNVKLERKGRVVSRGKVVRADFIAGNEHWSRGPLRLNAVELQAESFT